MPTKSFEIFTSQKSESGQPGDIPAAPVVPQCAPVVSKCYPRFPKWRHQASQNNNYWYKIKWFPDIYTNLDPVVAESHYNSIMNLLKIDKIKIFFLHDILLKKNKHLRQNKKIIFLSDLHYKYNIFDNDMLSTGAFSIRLAIFLGFYNIDFIGIDCNYTNHITGSKKLKDNKLIISEDITANENYFVDNYQQKGDIYQIPDVNKDFHLRSINSIYNDLEKLKVKLNIVNLGKNKKILFS